MHQIKRSVICCNLRSQISCFKHSKFLNLIIDKQVRQQSTSTVTYENIFNQQNKDRISKRLSSDRPIAQLPRKKQPGQNKKAAVLVPLCTVNGEPSILFTLRSNKIPQHRGEVCFPGGNMDSGDENLRDTALREMEEEIGISQNKVDVWGKMEPAFPSRKATGPLVNAVIGHIGEVDISSLEFCNREVEAVFTRSIKSLCNPKKYGYTAFRTGYSMPVFFGDDKPRIWGLTAVVLHFSLLLLAPNIYEGPFASRKTPKHRS